MAMNGEHLSPKTRVLLDRPIEERIAYIQMDSWVPYSQANRILQQLEDLLNHPRCDRLPNLAISAQTNNGKTRLLKHFLSLYQATKGSGGTISARFHNLLAACSVWLRLEKEISLDSLRLMTLARSRALRIVSAISSACVACERYWK
jgi:hypothetical protein